MPAGQGKPLVRARASALGAETIISFALEEYKTLREECSQARREQQATLQWSMAAYSVILAGTLAYLREQPAQALSIAVIVLAMGLPGFTIASSIVWYGELQRMGRASHYLQVREEALAKLASRSSLGVDDLLLRLTPSFERAVAGRKPVGRGALPHRIVAGYLGAVSIYVGATLISLLAFAAFLQGTDPSVASLALFREHGRATKQLGYVYSSFLWIGYVFAFGAACYRLMKADRVDLANRPQA
jgi:hypothetical protein